MTKLQTWRGLDVLADTLTMSDARDASVRISCAQALEYYCEEIGEVHTHPTHTPVRMHAV